MYHQNGRRPFIKKRHMPVHPQQELVNAILNSQLQTPSKQPAVEEYRMKFTDMKLIDELKNSITKKGYEYATPIQSQTIPLVIQGKDVIGIANTGTGKTAAFLIPCIQKVFQNRQEKILILTPTRELAIQIFQELKSLSPGMGFKGALIVGGMNIGRQIDDISYKPQFVIATPGRLKDFIKERLINLQDYKTVVLDEADRMVDIGFIRDIKYFISLLPSQRQSLFFTATLSSKVREILVNFVKDPVTVSVKKQETAASIYQDIIRVLDKSKKIDQLHDVLLKEGMDKVLIFGRTKWNVEKLARELINRGFKAGSIHGNKRQSQRQRTLDMFKKNEISILLATDVASRGLDIQGVSHVINFDVPDTYEDYVHRIGRTGRADREGNALTFIE